MYFPGLVISKIWIKKNCILTIFIHIHNHFPLKFKLLSYNEEGISYFCCYWKKFTFNLEQFLKYIISQVNIFKTFCFAKLYFKLSTLWKFITSELWKLIVLSFYKCVISHILNLTIYSFHNLGITQLCNFIVLYVQNWIFLLFF